MEFHLFPFNPSSGWAKGYVPCRKRDYWQESWRAVGWHFYRPAPTCLPDAPQLRPPLPGNASGAEPVGGRRMKHTSSSTWGAAPTRGDAPQHRPHDPDEGCPQSPEDSFLWLTPTTSWTQAQSLASTSFPAPCQTSSLPADRLLNSLVAHPVLFVFSILPVISFPTMDGRVHL